MTAIIMREKSHELKSILHKAMEVLEDMCEGEMGERYGERGGGYGERGDYPEYPYMGERRGVRGTGRYSRY